MTPTSDGLRGRTALWVILAALVASGCGGGVVRPSHAFKGNDHLDAGRPFEAIDEYRQALAEDPTDYRMTYNLGLAWHDAWRMLRGRGESAEAKAAFERARECYLRVHEELDPDNARALCSLAVLEDEAGETASARRRLESFLEGAGAESFLPNYTLAAMDLRAGDREAAGRRLRQALATNPTHVPSAVALVETLRETGGSYEEMEAVLDGVGESNPFDFTLAKQRARLHLDRARDLGQGEDWRQAHAALRRAHRLNESDWEIALGLSECHEQAGEVREAVYHLWRAQSLIADDRAEAWRTERDRIAGEIPGRLQALYRRLASEDPGGRP